MSDGAYLLTFYGYKFAIQLEAPGTGLTTVLDRRWSCHDRIIYLSLGTRNDYGSYTMDETVKLAFDFERGFLYTLNGPWRLGSPDQWEKRAASEAEFSDVLRRAEENCQPAPYGK